MQKLLRSPFVRRIALGAAFACAPIGAALAADDPSSQDPSWVERRVGGLERSLAFFGGGEERSAAPRSNVQQAQASMADIAVRLDRIENQMRQLNGRLDEMQFQIKRGEETQKRFQSDAEFRFQDLEGGKGGGGNGGGAKPGKRTDAGPSSNAQVGDLGGGASGGGGAGAPPSNLGAASRDGGGSSSGSGRGDAIGGLIDEGGPGDDPGGPMSIRPPGAGQSSASVNGGGAGTADSGGGRGVSVGTGNARDQFDMGVGFMQRRDYELAEQTFRDFIRSNPNDPLAADAQYWLGESLYQRKQYTDAADSFYKIYVEKPQSAKAPESMLKLGMSLNGMGKKEEACATIAEAGKKYSRIRSQSDREFKRISC